MPASLDSSRPIMAPSLASSTPRASVRYSAYSMAAPSLSPTVQSNDPAHAEIHHYEHGVARMENQALTKQRVALSEAKVDNLNTLALGAKLERALERRMSTQDAVMRPRTERKMSLPSFDGENEKVGVSHR